MSERLMADFACLDPVYVDGIAGFGNLGANFSTFFFRWVVVRIENGRPIYEKSPVLNLIRPQASIICNISRALLTTDQPPREAGLLMH